MEGCWVVEGRGCVCDGRGFRCLMISRSSKGVSSRSDISPSEGSLSTSLSLTSSTRARDMVLNVSVGFEVHRYSGVR